MEFLQLRFPSSIYIDKFSNWILSDEKLRNIINIDGTDYIVDYYDTELKTNKGAHSIILKLYEAQEFDEIDSPDLILKVCKHKLTNTNKKDIKIRRFNNEVDVLIECKKQKFQNIISIYHKGVITIDKKNYKGRKGRSCLLFYTMEYGEYDLKQYIEKNCLDLFKKIDLCLEIANGINQLFKLNYYHRDIKPDNIFVVGGIWKIGDLGLVQHRNEESSLDFQNELIGPRGWFCPEAMNKYLTEGKNFKFRFDCSIDHQSDIFQMGKVFWYILQGNAPIGAIKSEDFRIKDSDLYAIIRTMLNHSKKRRYDTIDEVAKFIKPIYNKYFKSLSS